MEILAHPAVKSGLTHCGYSSTLEFVTAGVPPLVFPHISEQALDAKTLTESIAAIAVIPPTLAQSRDDEPSSLQFE